ncbi:hypothetical protein HNQ94_002261 [Salirhabdus euzebyi]|uniref:Permease n=1 Tax=Salirhabdus euzebyi TaxID=394506 RepID=A0A841Q5X5_9BACI|nr:hypothetical protein [Salirhabdus euzebyi]MBB6453810.1 hypothetical protein [Salirhabdus euzebyi]
MLQKWGKGGSVIVIAGIALIISLFLPWVDLGIFSVSGFQQEGYLVLILFAYPLYVAFANKPINAIAGLATSIISVVFLFYFLSSKSESLFGETINAAGTGLYLALVASFVLVVGVVLKIKESK